MVPLSIAIKASTELAKEQLYTWFPPMSIALAGSTVICEEERQDSGGYFLPGDEAEAQRFVRFVCLSQLLVTDALLQAQHPTLCHQTYVA